MTAPPSRARSPSAFTLQRVVGIAQATLDSLRTEHGQVFEDDAEIQAALAEEGVGVEAVLTRLVTEALDAKAMGAKQDARMEDLRERRARSKRREDAYRTAIAQVMEAIDVRKFVCAEASLSIRDGNLSVRITDEAKLPPQFVEVTTTRTPNKAAIKAWINAGNELDCAVLSNGQPILTVTSR